FAGNDEGRIRAVRNPRQSETYFREFVLSVRCDVEEGGPAHSKDASGKILNNCSPIEVSTHFHSLLLFDYGCQYTILFPAHSMRKYKPSPIALRTTTAAIIIRVSSKPVAKIIRYPRPLSEVTNSATIIPITANEIATFIPSKI